MKEKQEIHCHECDKYVQFEIDLSLNGNHILKCPNCGHEHCRVVKNGVITDDRWDSRNTNIYITKTTTTDLSLYHFVGYTPISQSWINASCCTA